MKILFITHRYPPHTGGIETHVEEIATRLVEHGHEVTVFSADAGDDVPSESTVEGVKVRRFQSLSPGGAFYFAPQIALAIRRADADIVHAHNYHAFPLFCAALGVTDEQFVVTTHYHGGSANGLRDTLLSFYQLVGQWAVRQADEVITVSEWEQKRLCEDFGVDSTVVPNGIQRNRFLSAEPVEREKPYVLCAGRLERYKGIQYAIRSLPHLAERELVVAGSGPYRSSLEAVAADVGVMDRVTFLGYVKDDDLPRLFSGADAYLQLSEFEAYGMTVAESIAAGTPVVVRKAGALVDWLELTGTIGVADIDPRTIATAVKEAADGPDPNTHAVPNWDAVVGRLFELYQGRQQEA